MHPLLAALIPALDASQELCMEMFPYLVYYAFRFAPNLETQLPDDVSAYLLSILKSETPFYQLVDLVLKTLDFLAVAGEQDKAIFKNFIE